MLREAIEAPAFSLPDQEGRVHTLSDYLGKWVILYFYPKDNTPGCTKEACSFRDLYSEFMDIDAVILGVSADSQKKHANFAEKFSLPFSLLSDPEKEMINAYEAWGLKKFMGKEYEGIYRISYLINPEGVIARSYDTVNPLAHSATVLADIKSMR
jgi:thioredoxin-dependent peroxiredoxin